MLSHATRRAALWLAPLLLAGIAAGQMYLRTEYPGGGSFVGEGVMFDVEATGGQDLRVVSLDAHLTTGTDTASIYTRQGTHEPYWNTSGGWRLVGSTTVSGAGEGVPTPLGIPMDVIIRAGERQAFYVTFTGAGRVFYEPTASTGVVQEYDGNLTVYTGSAGSSLFWANDEANWNGTIHYEVGSHSLETEFTGSLAADGHMFPVLAGGGRDLIIHDLDANLPAGTHGVMVYSRLGSFVGHETSIAGWSLQGAAVVESHGAGQPTPMNLDMEILVPAGEMVSLYVHSNGGQRHTNGDPLGGGVSDRYLVVGEGRTGSLWNITSSLRIWNGVVRYELAPSVSTGCPGGNGQTGNMFDLHAWSDRDVLVRRFDAHLTAGPTTVEIWTRAGSYLGHEHSSAGWTLVDTASVNGLGEGHLTPVPIDIDVTIPSGEVQGFYLYSSNGVRYTNGTGVSSTAANDINLGILEGAGGAYFDLTFAPRIWNGTVYYEANETCISAGFRGASSASGAMFDAVAAPGGDVTVHALSGSFLMGVGTVEIWTRPGTFHGHESSIAGWTQLATTTVSPLGLNEPTLVPIPFTVTIPAGQTQAFYVTSTSGVIYTPGYSYSRAAVRDPDLAIMEGNVGPYFSVTHGVNAWNGNLLYSTAGGGGLCPGICGDCNEDGVGPTVLDSLAAAQMGAGLVTPSLSQQACCDVDGTGAITVLDALRMAQSAAGLPAVLSCQ